MADLLVMSVVLHSSCVCMEAWMLGWLHVVSGPLFPCGLTSSRMSVQALTCSWILRGPARELQDPLEPKLWNLHSGIFYWSKQVTRQIQFQMVSGVIAMPFKWEELNKHNSKEHGRRLTHWGPLFKDLPYYVQFKMPFKHLSRDVK